MCTRRPGSLAHDVMHGLVEGTRGRGRPKRTWLRDITDWTGIGITECVKEAEDRQKWRKIVNPLNPKGRPKHESLSIDPKGRYTVFHVLLFVYKLHSNSMANQSASNNQPRPARDTRPSGCNILTGARCSLSQIPPKRFTAH